MNPSERPQDTRDRSKVNQIEGGGRDQKRKKGIWGGPRAFRELLYALRRLFRGEYSSLPGPVGTFRQSPRKSARKPRCCRPSRFTEELWLQNQGEQNLKHSPAEARRGGCRFDHRRNRTDLVRFELKLREEGGEGRTGGRILFKAGTFQAPLDSGSES